MRTPADAELNRAATATSEFIPWACSDFPPAYQALMPVTTSAAKLLQAEKMIREMIDRDVDRWLNDPKRHVGPLPKLVNWSDDPSSQHLALLDPNSPHARGNYEVLRPGREGHPDAIDVSEWRASDRDAIYVEQTLSFVLLRAAHEITAMLDRARQDEKTPQWKVKALREAEKKIYAIWKPIEQRLCDGVDAARKTR